MNPGMQTQEQLLASLRERTKELNCLYELEGLLNRTEPLEETLQSVTDTICTGWQFPDICRVELVHGDRVFRSANFATSPWMLTAEIFVQEEQVGTLNVYYIEERPTAYQGPFMHEETRLVNNIAQRLGHYLLYQRMKDLHQTLDRTESGRDDDWRAPIHLLRESDRNLYVRLARKMLNHLYRIGVTEARSMLSSGDSVSVTGETGEQNVPGPRREIDHLLASGDRPFELAAKHLSSSEMLSRVQRWMQEDKAGFFMNTLHNPRSSLPEIADAVRRFHHFVADGAGLPESTRKSMRVSLCQRLLTEQLDFVRTAKDYVRIADFIELVDRMILPAGSHGKLGGKSAGLVLAHSVLNHTRDPKRPVGEIKIPRTWYLASDGLSDFVGYNDLQDVIEQKFKDIDEIRHEYPNIIQLFKNSPFPPRVITGLSVALDDLGDVPLIVRSSSLLEDRLGTAFSGKYKSLFVGNQGTKEERLSALLDAIAEVYASTFGPDPIEYRREHGLLEFHEEMGILIQEVVGTRVGKYYLPAFAGVAFSNNEFRWSPRIKREDGLIRLVPGLGTRAVDRVPDDYPMLIVPKRPQLRANVAIDEVVRYAPKKLDAIDLETNTLVTVSIRDLLRQYGRDYPAIENVFSVLRGDMLQKPVALMLDPAKDELVPDFRGLANETPFIMHLGNILGILQTHLRTPVDIEFAHDGRDFYLLQCRPQSFAGEAAPAPIPRDLPAVNVLFSANRYVSNGWIPDITHIVYVDPGAYSEIESRDDMLAVGRAVGQLNKLLPKRQFILMGPGRWGSRGDIKLGVSVTYADINNTAMLIEIARKKGQYLPDLSFGTHFFQDLVESRIRYLPLYPDKQGIMFNEDFFLKAPNLLAEMLPGMAGLAPVLRVIDVAAAAQGRILRVLMNAELDEAVGVLTTPGGNAAQVEETAEQTRHEPIQYWRWRMEMVEKIAEEMDAQRFGVVALYVFGSVKNGTAGPASDIDLLIHFRGDDRQREALALWLDGWSICLAELNYRRTGYKKDRLLDVEILTDEDIAAKTSYAAKIGAVTDAAREVMLGKREQETAIEGR
ncbi:MAG: nucleotidyltransferase domain-containing protein [Candidatus Eisenbacteria bacterium]|nr:nucleotidyltransferase domain-containing protein [Candidatus Eisenbacteria bacterium]